jgi:hypothetical protein
MAGHANLPALPALPLLSLLGQVNRATLSCVHSLEFIRVELRQGADSLREFCNLDEFPEIPL